MLSAERGITICRYEVHFVFPKDNAPGYDIFIRLELLKPLYERLREKPLTEKEIIKLGIDICAALEILEREHILHLDIKPSNIFLGSAGEYKLGDYGFAGVLNRTPANMPGGRAYDYIAPEQPRGTYIDHRADLYALGRPVPLCNAGRNPFLLRRRRRSMSQTTTGQRRED
jgi:serine/threonine-protein kinase